jgi:hypothetical protein
VHRRSNFFKADFVAEKQIVPALYQCQHHNRFALKPEISVSSHFIAATLLCGSEKLAAQLFE